jgi:serine/threonine-protein kinase
VLGSASYVSPEQARGERADERTDLYALGCVLYAMLAGRPPFVADSPLATLYRHVHDEPEPPSRFAPTVPTSLESIVLRCLAKRRQERFASAADLEGALGDLESPGGTRPLPVTTDGPERAPTRPIAAATAPGPRRRTQGGVLAGAVVAAVMALAALAVAALDDPGLGRAGAPTRRGSDAGRSPGADAGEPTPSVSTVAPGDVTGAIATLLEAVDGAVLSGAFAEEKDAEKLRDRVLKVAGFSGNGDVEQAAAEAAKLDEELAKLVDQDRISPEAATDIGAALDAVLVAMDVDPAADVGSGGPGNGNGNAFGHEDGDDEGDD